LIHA
jgi:hypothetical protein